MDNVVIGPWCIVHWTLNIGPWTLLVHQTLCIGICTAAAGRQPSVSTMALVRCAGSVYVPFSSLVK